MSEIIESYINAIAICVIIIFSVVALSVMINYLKK